MVALVNDRRLQRGLPPLGFLNPALYQLREQGHGDALYDVSGDEGTGRGAQPPQGWAPWVPGWGSGLLLPPWGVSTGSGGAEGCLLCCWGVQGYQCRVGVGVLRGSRGCLGRGRSLPWGVSRESCPTVGWAQAVSRGSLSS